MMVNWLEEIGSEKMLSLAQDHNIVLDERMQRFLEQFANVVEQASHTRRERARKATLALRDLRTVNNVVNQEVQHARYNLLGSSFEAEQRLFVRRHIETCLPVVHFQLKDLPEMVLHVRQSYGTQGVGVSFGFLAHGFCGGRLTGAVARAANYLRVQCRSRSWQMSLTEIMNMWKQQAEGISGEERAKGRGGGEERPNKRKSWRLDAHEAGEGDEEGEVVNIGEIFEGEGKDEVRNVNMVNEGYVPIGETNSKMVTAGVGTVERGHDARLACLAGVKDLEGEVVARGGGSAPENNERNRTGAMMDGDEQRFGGIEGMVYGAEEEIIARGGGRSGGGA